MNENLKLQYQLSNGMWVDCEERTDEFLTRCEQNNSMTRDEVVAALLTGRTLRNDPQDWYMNCRSGRAYEEAMTRRQAAQKPVEMVRCSCGHTVPRSQVMSASTGTACPECYDRMSE